MEKNKAIKYILLTFFTEAKYKRANEIPISGFVINRSGSSLRISTSISKAPIRKKSAFRNFRRLVFFIKAIFF